jgi:hypothetical protein
VGDQVPLEIPTGADWSNAFGVLASDGTPLVVTDPVLEMRRDRTSHSQILAHFDASGTSNGLITILEPGRWVLSMTADQTSLLPTGRGFWDCFGKVNGALTPITSGIVVIRPRVTSDTGSPILPRPPGSGGDEVVTFPTGSEPSLDGVSDGTLWIEYSPDTPSFSLFSVFPDPIDAATDTPVTVTGTGLNTVTLAQVVGTMGGEVQNTQPAPLTEQGPTELGFVVPAQEPFSQNPFYAWTLELTGPNGVITAPLTYAYPRDPACSGHLYPGVTEITAQDANNAALLSGLGFVAEPQTPWGEGEAIGISPEPAGEIVDVYVFHWDGTDWQPGYVPSPPPAPTFTAIVPDNGPAGQSNAAFHLIGTGLATNSITGASFGAASLYLDNNYANTDTEIAFTGWTDSNLMVPGTYPVTFSSNTGADPWRDSGLEFTLNAAPAGPPTFGAITPNPYTLDGTPVQFDIAGTNFLAADFGPGGGSFPNMYDGGTDTEIPLSYATITDTVITMKTPYGIASGREGTYSIYLPTTDGGGFGGGTIDLI